MRKETNRLGYREQRKVEDIIRPLLLIIDDLTCEYLEGWSDEKAAERVMSLAPFQCTKKNVEFVRGQVFGAILKKEKTGDPLLAARLSAIEARLAILETALT